MVKKEIKFIGRLSSCALVLFLVSCAPIEVPQEYKITTLPAKSEIKVGVYHKVGKGETIWRIAKTYGVGIDEIIQENHIPNVALIEENQLLFIPGVKTVKPVLLDENEGRNDFIWPVKGKVVRYFHDKKEGRLNRGVDIKTRAGEIVKASRTGRVVFADFLTGHGYMVILDHEDGYATVYSQNAVLLTQFGEMVVKNSQIARVGKTGNEAYLHFEIRKNAIEDNPLYYLP